MSAIRSPFCQHRVMSLFNVRTIEEIDELCVSEMDLVLKMLQDRLLPRNPVCSGCGETMVLRLNADRIEWQCSPQDDSSACPPRCIREGSWFQEHPALSLRTILKIIILYGKGFCDLEMHDILVLPKGVLGELRRRLEAVCFSIVDSYGPLGGANVAIQLREAAFTVKRPSNSSKISALVGVDLSSGRCFAQELHENNVADATQILMRWVQPETFNGLTDFGHLGGVAVEEFINRFKVPILRSEEDRGIQGYLNEVVLRVCSGRNFTRELLYQMQVLKRPLPPPLPSKTETLLRDSLTSIVRSSSSDDFYHYVRGTRKRTADDGFLEKINGCNDIFNTAAKVKEEESGFMEEGAVNAVNLLRDEVESADERLEQVPKRAKRLTGHNAIAKRLSCNNDGSPASTSSSPDPMAHLSELSVEQLDEMCQTELDLAVLMMEQNFLPRDPPCFNCGRIMTLRLRGKNSDTTAEWRCRDSKNRRDCSSRSVRTGSWFASSAMPLKAMIKMLFLWSKGIAPATASSTLKISLSTVISYREMFKDVCSRVVSTYEPLGGFNYVVHVAQYRVVTRKFGRGQRVTEPNKIILGVDSSTGRVFIELESSGNEEKVLSTLKKWIKIGSIVNGIPFDGVAVPAMDGGAETQRVLEAVQPSKLSNMTTHTFPGYLAEMVVRLTEGDNFLRRVMCLMSCGGAEALPPMDRANSRRQNEEIMKHLEQLIGGMSKEEMKEAEIKQEIKEEIKEEERELELSALISPDEKPEGMTALATSTG